MQARGEAFAPAAAPPSALSGSAPGPPPLDPASYRPHTLASDLDRNGRLPFATCLDIGLGLANALDHLHRAGLVHRDIKPANIVFVNGLPKLADIGSVTGAGAGTIVGTEGYMPPEGHGTAAADVFSLGRVLYEMATGRDRTDFPQLPVGFEDLDEHDRLLELNAVVLKAGAHVLAERYPSAAALHEALVKVQAGGSVRREERLKRALRWARVAIAALALLGLALWLTMRIKAERKVRAR
jgi:serine/threonine protein kinase